MGSGPDPITESRWGAPGIVVANASREVRFDSLHFAQDDTSEGDTF